MTVEAGVLRLITDASEARTCFDTLVDVFTELADDVAPHKATFRLGNVTATTYFFRRHDIWIMPTDGSQLSKSKNRYWNSFGLGGNRQLATNRISIEINHPHTGKSHVEGRFLASDNRFYIGHTGKIGGGIPGSDAAAIERVTGRPRNLVEIDGSPQKLAFISSVEPSEVFIERLAHFVRNMESLREQLKAASTKGSWI